MTDALHIAKTGLNAQQTRMSVISNNLANVNTVGFKRDRASFESLLYQTEREVGSQTSQNTQSPTGLAIGTGVRIAASEKLYNQGNIISTDNSLDMTVEGGGFFQSLMPNGQTAYTVGIVSVAIPGQTKLTQVGQIETATFPNNSGLKQLGGTLALETSSSGAPNVGAPGSASHGTILQGALEASNVNVVEELVSMIETQRAYEVNSKAISSIDGMLKFLTQNV